MGADGRDALVLGLDAPGFEDLTRGEKTLAYCLYRAAIAGNDILYMQNHRDALAIKQLFEAIHTHSDGAQTELRDGVHDYLKRIWIHHGNYHHWTHSKFVPTRFSAEGLRGVANVATRNGAQIDPVEITRLERAIFDADFEPLQSNQADDEDMVATSAVNFWDPGVTQADLDNLSVEWQNKINVRYKKDGDKIVPQTYKIGGVFSRELETVAYFLERAIPFTLGEEQRRSIELLLDFYRVGDEELFRQHSVAWLKANTTVDYLNGFIEQYIDPRGIIANFEGNVSYASDAAIVDRLSENALYFEERMPWPDEYKRGRIAQPVAKVVNVLVETGDAGPISPAAYNLPNYNDIRRDHGSKNVILLNVEKSRSHGLLEKIAGEFYLPEYRASVLKYAHNTIRPLEVYLHEIIGHGSGQPAATLAVDPRTAIGRSYSALEECRADLVALYHLSDPKLVEIGALGAGEQPVIVETAYIIATQGWMTRYDHVDGLEVREAHNKANEMILRYLVEGGETGSDFGIEVIDRDGNYFVRLTDAALVRVGIAELLGRIQVIKATGDARAGDELVRRFGTRLIPEWHDNIVARLHRLNMPKLKAFVFPHLTPVIENDVIVDVKIAFDEDLTAQQLRFARLQRSTDITAD